ncbi:hypothetical protein Taro_001198, partial [Colocasia esculenta]|nr:hypothetical protein [Colocasia esculenta]
MTTVLSVRTVVSGETSQQRQGACRVGETGSSLAFSRWFFVLVVLVLRWCRPVRAGDMLVVLGARRKWSFLREGPNGLALLLE